MLTLLRNILTLDLLIPANIQRRKAYVLEMIAALLLLHVLTISKYNNS